MQGSSGSRTAPWSTRPERSRTRRGRRRAPADARLAPCFTVRAAPVGRSAAARPHGDRLGSARLIKRFIDPDAEFVFARPDEFPPDAIPFDALGAEFGHQGEDCTFETLIKRCGLRDERLRELAEIVHEVDLRDDKYRRAEARGIDLAIRGLLAALKDDHEALAHGLTLFDGLYAAVRAGRR